jgi:rRNA maturation endonuclease Nob1
MAVAAAATERCQRCGTKIRNRRTLCPSCGHDLKAVVEPVAEAPTAETQATPSSGVPMIKKVAAKAGVKMCGICMASVPEAEMVEANGQKVCPSCAENMKNKAMKKAASGPPTDTTKK